MNKIKSILAFVALMLCGGAWASAFNTQVYWNDGMSFGTKNGFTLTTEGGCDIANNAAIIEKSSTSSNAGVKITWDSQTTVRDNLIVFVKYSGLQLDDTNFAPLVSVYWKTNSNEVDLLAKSGSVNCAYGVTSSDAGNQQTAGNVDTIPSEGMMAVAFFGSNAGDKGKGAYVAFAAKKDDGTYEKFSNVKRWSSVTYSDSPFYAIKIGGSLTGSSFYKNAGMKIEGIAVSDSKTGCTPNGISYMFPNDGVSFDSGSSNIGGSNAKASVVNCPAVTLAMVKKGYVTALMSTDSSAFGGAVMGNYTFDAGSSTSYSTQMQIDESDWRKAVVITLEKTASGITAYRAGAHYGNGSGMDIGTDATSVWDHHNGDYNCHNLVIDLPFTHKATVAEDGTVTWNPAAPTDWSTAVVSVKGSGVATFDTTTAPAIIHVDEGAAAKFTSLTSIPYATGDGELQLMASNFTSELTVPAGRTITLVGGSSEATKATITSTITVNGTLILDGWFAFSTAGKLLPDAAGAIEFRNGETSWAVGNNNSACYFKGAITVWEDAKLTLTSTSSKDIVNTTSLNVYGELCLNDRFSIATTDLYFYAGSKLTGTGDQYGALDMAGTTATVHFKKNPRHPELKDIVVNMPWRLRKWGSYTKNTADVDEGVVVEVKGQLGYGNTNSNSGGALNKTGLGTLKITGPESDPHLFGDLVVEQGRVIVAANPFLSTATSGITVKSGAYFGMSTDSTPIARNITVEAGGAITFPANWAADTAYTLTTGTVTASDANGVTTYVGDAAQIANLDYEGATVKYTLVRAAGDVYLVHTSSGAAYTYVTSDGTSTSLIDGDTVNVDRNTGHYTADLWGGGLNLTSLAKHTVKIGAEIDLGGTGGIPAGQNIEINYSASSNKGIYLYNGIGDGATVGGTGALYFGYGPNQTKVPSHLGNNVTISCTTGFADSGRVAIIEGAVTITGTIVTSNGSEFKIAEGGSLTVSATANVGTITSNVLGMLVRRTVNGDTATYDIVAPVVKTVIDGTTTYYATLQEALTAIGSGDITNVIILDDSIDTEPYGVEDGHLAAPVAQIDETQYSTFAKAFAAAQEAGATAENPTEVTALRSISSAVEIPEYAVVFATFANRITGALSGSGTYKIINTPSMTTTDSWDKTIGNWFGAGSLTSFNGTLWMARGRFQITESIESGRVALKVTDGAQLYVKSGTISNSIEISGNGMTFEPNDTKYQAVRLDGATYSGKITAVVTGEGDDKVVPRVGTHNATGATITGDIIAPDGIKLQPTLAAGVITITSIKGSATDTSVACAVEKVGAGKIVIPADCTATFTLLAGTIQSDSAELNVSTTVEDKVVGCAVSDSVATYSLVDPVASITVNGETRNYVSLEAAITAAKKGETVTLLAASNETITIPENVTVDPGNQSFTGTIKGSGTYIIHYSNNSTAMTQPPSGVTAPEWTGTIWVIGNGANTNANDFNCTDTGKALYSHTGSKLALTGINGYFKCFNGGTVAAKEVKLFDDGTTKALVIADGAGANGFLIKKLTGTGTLADRDSGPANRGVTIEDASEFEGNIDVSYKMAVKLGTSKVGSGTAKTIVVSGAVKGKNQTWTAGSGITFENSASIDITDGALITSSDVIFGSDITIKGGDAGSTVMTASGTVTGVPTVTLINQDGVEVEGDFALVKDENNLVKIVALTESIATVDGVECKSLKSAIKQAQTTGKPIVLLGDFAANGNVIPSGVVIDLDGHNLTGTFKLQSGAYILEGTGDNKHVKIDGFATSFDVTFNTKDTATTNGHIDYQCLDYVRLQYDSVPSYINETAESGSKTMGVYLKHHPYVHNLENNNDAWFMSTDEITLAVVGQMPKKDNTIFLHMGRSATKNGLFLATGTNTEEVVICYNKLNAITEVTRMTVPNARAARHTYVVTKHDDPEGTPNRKTTFTVYLDGEEWNTVQFDHFIITGGVQVGKPYGANFSGWNNVENNENSANYDGESYINVIRIYDRVITEAEIKQYSVVEEYPYNSPNGNFERSNWADTNWKASDAWTKTSVNPQESSDLPLKGIVTATFAGNTEVIVNQTEETNYEKLTIDGTGTITFTCGEGATAIKSIATVVNTPIIINKDSLDLSSGPTKLGTNGAITFNFAALSSENWGRDLDDPLSGQMTSSENIHFVAPTDPKIYAQLVYENKVYRIRARLYAALYNGTYYLDVVDALTAAGENITEVVIINGSKVLPDGYRDYAIDDDGHIVTTVNARTATKGFVSLATAAAYCVEGDVIELLADDTSAVVLNKNITIDNSADRTASGVISGAFSVTKTGAGKLKLTGGNTFTGALQIDAGVAEISATSSGYNLVLNGGAIKAAVADAHSTLIKSLTLEKDSAFGSSSDECGVVGLGTGEGGASTLNLKGHKLDIWSSNNVYFESTTVTPSAGTIHLHSGNLLTHHAPLDLTGSKIIVDSGATIEIDGANNGITVTDLEYNGNESKGGTGGIKVLGNLSGTGTIKYLTLSGAVTVSGSVIVSTTLSTTDGTSIGFADGATLTTAGNYTTQGISGNGTLIVSGGTITAKNKPSGYAVDDATVRIDGGTFTVYLGNGDPQIRNAKFVINGGELKTHGWVTMVGTIELDAASNTTIFGSSTYNPSFRGTPNIIKSGDGNVTIKAGVDTGARFSSLTLNGGSLTLTADVAVDRLVSGDAHKTVHYDSATRTYSLIGPIATVDGVDCFTKEDLAAHPQGTLVIVDTNRVTIDGDQVLVDGVALPSVTIDGEKVLSPAKEAAGDTGLRISEICPKLTLWDENHRDAGWLEVVNNGTAYANLKDYNIARFNHGKEVKKVTDWKCGVDVWVAPGARAVIKTSEDYPKADDKQITRYAELNNALVLGAKINPKKYPVVVLAKGKTTIQNCVVPVDVPENKSVCYDGSKRANNAVSENGATVSYITTATKGTANDFTNAVAVGPQVTSLYGVADAPDPWIAFPKAQLSTDYTVKLPVNPVYGLSETEDSPDRITKVQLIYQIGFTTPVTNDTEMVKSETKDAAKGWLYTGTIPASALTEAGQVVKFAVKITDGAGNEWRSPSFNNPEDGFQWYGTIIEPTAEQTDGGITTLHIFADPDEVADTPGSSDRPATDPLMNIDADDASYKTEKHPYGAYVGIYDNDTGMYYDSVRIDKRGNTTGKFTKKAHGLKFAKAQPFTGKDSVSGKTIECRKSSFTAEYADPAFVRQELSFKMMNDNGSPAPFHYPVRLNLNGEFYQLAFHTERFSDELIEDFYGLDGKGYGYKNIGPFNPGLRPVSGGIEKKTPDDGVTSDNGVLDAFCRKMEDVELISEGHTEGNPTPTADSEFETEFSRTLTKVVTTDFDLPAWLNYIALTKITGETDDVWANLSGYYDVNGTGTWMPLVYDTNQSFGQWHKSDDPNMATEMERAGKNCANYDHFKAHPLYGGHHIMVHYSGGAPYSAADNGTTARKPYKGNRCFEAIFQNAKYRRLYLRRLRTLMDAEFGGASADQEHTPMYQRAKEMVDRYSKVAAKDRAIWTNYETSAQELWVFGHKEAGWTAEDGLEWMWDNYIQKRREHLYVTHAAEGHEGQIGYGETLCAGIPAAQSSIDTLKGKFAVEWDDDHQAVVLKNKNAEAVDVSGWAVAGRIAFVFPAGTVIDQGTEEEPGTLYITADRKATVASFGSDINDQTIIGNGTANAGVEAIVVRTNTGLRILGDATDQETWIRFESIYGNTTGDGDTGEWFTLKNIGSTADVNLEGMTICILKDGDPESGTHCHVTLTSKSKPGTLESGASKKFDQSKFVDYGFSKIQNNKLNIKLYDKYGINYQTLAVTQKDYPIAYGKGAYLVADKTSATVKKGDWHQVYDASVQGDLTLEDWTKKEDSFKAMDKDLTVLVNDTVTIDLQNPTFGEKASLKLKGTGVATIKGTATKTNGSSTVINSEGSLVFEDGTYTFTTENDCIQADGDITINGGTFICHSTGNDGIDANGDIIINGGTIFAFTAATEEDGNKSTGLDVNTGHKITINGGTVIATSLAKAALEAMTINGQTTKIVEVEGVSGATKAIGDVIVTFPTMETSPAAVLVSTPNLTEEAITAADPDTVEIVAEDAVAGTDAVHATVPASWVVDKEGDAKVAAAEAFVLGLAEPTEKPVVSSEQTTEADSIRIVDNVAPRFGTGVTVKRTLFVGTTPGEEEADTSIEETNGGFTVPLPNGSEPKVKYIKIKYSFE